MPGTWYWLSPATVGARGSRPRGPADDGRIEGRRPERRRDDQRRVLGPDVAGANVTLSAHESPAATATCEQPSSAMSNADAIRTGEPDGAERHRRLAAVGQRVCAWRARIALDNRVEVRRRRWQRQEGQRGRRVVADRTYGWPGLTRALEREREGRTRSGHPPRPAPSRGCRMSSRHHSRTPAGSTPIRSRHRRCTSRLERLAWRRDEHEIEYGVAACGMGHDPHRCRRCPRPELGDLRVAPFGLDRGELEALDDETIRQAFRIRRHQEQELVALRAVGSVDRLEGRRDPIAAGPEPETDRCNPVRVGRGLSLKVATGVPGDGATRGERGDVRRERCLGVRDDRGLRRVQDRDRRGGGSGSAAIPANMQARKSSRSRAAVRDVRRCGS